MKPLKVDWLQQDSLNEIYQKTGYHFAFMTSPKDGDKQACSWVKCRDFLQDAVAAYTAKSSCSIFGFRYKHGQHPPLDMSRTRMLVKKAQLNKSSAKTDVDRFRKELKAGQALVNHYERLAGVSLSTMRKVSDASVHVWRFRGPGFWMRSPFLISMYSFLIRIGDKVDIVDGFKDTPDLIKKLKKVSQMGHVGGDHDINYLGDCHDKMHLFIENLDDLIFGKGKLKLDKNYKHPTNSLHNYCGVHSLCRHVTPDETLNKKLKKLHQEAKKKK